MLRPITRGWVVRGEVPGPDVDEFADEVSVTTALARASAGSLLAVQHPHRTPAAIAAGLTLDDALPSARAALRELTRQAYRPVTDVIAPYQVDGPDGSAIGLLCMVEPDPEFVRHSEDVFPDVVAERARVLSGLGALTSAALLVPVHSGAELTAAVASATTGPPAVSTVDTSGRRHRLWLVDSPELLAVASAAPLMVADGNHRVAAAAQAGGLLAFVTAGPDLRIRGFHRVLRGVDPAALLDAWRGLDIRRAPDAMPPTQPGTLVAQLRGDRYVITLPREDGVIDHAVLESLLAAAGIDPAGPQVRTFPDGREPPDADVLLYLAPVPLPDVLAVHAAGGRMPRKSTYFTPKPRSGLLIAELGG
ncbi:hypothetical protein GCM10010171_62630 [Actinokineospora fastidiosa]|uniref:DUF1015 domain-containing protein n=1 Tax=Actinokineospora fastidiosa TaxID=1816 RepID=A0A918GUK9_9PSEU|nr:hypothetical protein GCM10010171_62630 [Actinokineospora fastidiosa]